MKSKIFFVAFIATLTCFHKSETQTFSTVNSITTETTSNKSFVPITFKNNDLEMSGNLYLPAGFDNNL